MSSPREATHAIGFDLEHWYQATLLHGEVPHPTDRVEDSVELVLDLLDRNGTRGTFFVVGEIAEEYPELVRRIARAGHELASHGHTHTPLYGRSPEWLERELLDSMDAIEDASGTRPAGFRAPDFSITRETAWALDVLRSAGYRYDSSVFPVRTPMYGVRGAPLVPYVIDHDDPFRPPDRGPEEDGLAEFPLAVLDSKLRVPLAGGFYARLGPIALVEHGLRWNAARGIPANLYFHPWEFNPEVRTDLPPPHKRFVSFFGIDRLERKVDRLLGRFEFGPVGEVLDGLGLPGVEDGGSPSSQKEAANGGTAVGR